MATPDYSILGMSDKLLVVKIGGDVLDKNYAILDDVVIAASHDIRTVIVPGAQQAINRAMEMRGLEQRFVNGLRVTDDACMEVYPEIIKRRTQDIVAYLGQARPVSGVVARRVDKSLGYVGEFLSMDSGSLQECLQQGLIAVVSTICVADSNDGYRDNNLLNGNADNVASGLASYLSADGLYIATNVSGLYLDGKVQPTIQSLKALALVSNGAVTGGMAQKLLWAAEAVEKGIPYACIFDGTQPYALINAIKQKEAGTVVKKEAQL